MTRLHVPTVRQNFPALDRALDGAVVVYADGPGGTQVPEAVVDAMSDYLRRGGSNAGGPFITSLETDEVVAAARSAVADLLGAGPAEVAFGQNMTSITLAVSRALGATWRRGDNIIVTRLDHDANVWPWVMAARDAGVEVRWADFEVSGEWGLDVAGLERLLDERTRVVAVTRASNALGTVVDVAAVARLAHRAGALVYVDAVHYAPHGVIDVAAWDCDFLVCSAYKFFGPHTGCLYGKSALLEELDVYRIRPAPEAPPGKWETGTQSFESLAGVTAAVDYLASLGTGTQRRSRLVSAMEAIGRHESAMAARFISALGENPRAALYGRPVAEGRTPTFAVDIAGVSPHEVAATLGEAGIFVWAGDYYAIEVMKRLDRASQGLVRVGFVHYNTDDEVDRVAEALAAVR